MEWSFYISIPTDLPPILFIGNKFNSCTTSFFFPMGLQIIICTVPRFIILLSVMFPHLQSIALRANFKKGDQSVSSNRNTSTIQECCHPHENIHIWVEEKRQGQTATYVCKAMCICQNVRCRVVPGYHPQMVISLRQTSH